MGSARVQGIACWWCDISNCLGDHEIVGLGGSIDLAFGYLKGGVFRSSLHSLLHHVSNTPTLCLLLVDLGPLPLLRPE